LFQVGTTRVSVIPSACEISPRTSVWQIIFADVDGFGLAFSHDGDDNFSALVGDGDPEPELFPHAARTRAARSTMGRIERRRMSQP
jgi:hypothetical protein